MKKEDFDLFADIVKKRSGIALTPEKAYLLESRLMPVARKLNLKDLEELAHMVRDKRDEKTLESITQAMTTNETFFFRDQKPFDQFRTVVLPYILKTRATQKTFRIWSAAASSGQEAYSLAMLLLEEGAKFTGWKVEILGTDLSTDMVERARLGIYNQFEVQRGLPITMLVKYFQQNGDKWQLHEKVRSMVQYKPLNLLQDWGGLGKFDVIFCRNVLIYFDMPTKTKLFERFAGALHPDGGLFLGGAETVLGATDCFKGLEGHHGIYLPIACPAGAWKAA